MPVDGSGNFTRSYNYVQDRINGIKIMAARVDGEFDNVAAAINLMFLRNGVAPMTGALNMNTNAIFGVSDGIAGTPAIRFNSDPTTGIFSPGFQRLAISAGGTNRFDVGTAGITASVPLTVPAVNFTSAPAIFNVAGTERIRIDASGNVGVGSVNGQSRLRVQAGALVNGPTLGSCVNYPAFLSNADGNYGIGIGVSAGDGHAWFQAQRADSSGLVSNITFAEAGGNVGIGVASPQERLDVSGNIRLSGANPTVWFGAGGPYVASTAANTIVIGTSGADRLALDTNGDVTSSFRARAVGFKGLPQNQMTLAYTLAASDMGGHLYVTAGTFTVTIPNNSTVAFPIGTQIHVICEDAGKTIAPAGGVALIQAGTGLTGNRNIAALGWATLVKVGTDRWFITGDGVT